VKAFATYNHCFIADMPKVGQAEQQMSKEVLLVEIESLRKQTEMNRVPMSSALQMEAAPHCFCRATLC